MELDCINNEIDRLLPKMAMLNERMRELMEKRRVILSQRWIEMNACKRADVKMSTATTPDGTPVKFDGMNHFLACIPNHDKLPPFFFEWEGRIYTYDGQRHWPIGETDGYVSELKV